MVMSRYQYMPPYTANVYSQFAQVINPKLNTMHHKLNLNSDTLHMAVSRYKCIYSIHDVVGCRFVEITYNQHLFSTDLTN